MNEPLNFDKALLTEDFKDSDVFGRDENVNDFILVFNDTSLDKLTNGYLNSNFKNISESCIWMVDEIANIMGIDLSEFGLDATEMRVAVAK